MEISDGLIHVRIAPLAKNSLCPLRSWRMENADIYIHVHLPNQLLIDRRPSSL